MRKSLERNRLLQVATRKKQRSCPLPLESIFHCNSGSSPRGYFWGHLNPRLQTHRKLVFLPRAELLRPFRPCPRPFRQGYKPSSDESQLAQFINPLNMWYHRMRGTEKCRLQVAISSDE